MKILILNNHSFLYSGLAGLTVQNHIKYCEQNCYEYITRLYDKDSIVAPYANVDFWQLRFSLPFYDAVVTVGTDVLFVNMAQRIEGVLKAGAEQQIADEHIGGSAFNNDVMIWTNKQSSFDLISHILTTRNTIEQAHPFNWQMQINNMLADKSPMVNKMATVDEHVMNTYPEHFVEGDFIVHFYNRKLVEKIEGVKKWLNR